MNKFNVPRCFELIFIVIVVAHHLKSVCLQVPNEMKASQYITIGLLI